MRLGNILSALFLALVSLSAYGASSMPAILTLSLPERAIGPDNLAVIVAAGDPLSESIARYYQTARGIPAENIISVDLKIGTDTISSADFAKLKAQIDAKLPGNIQATLLTWTAPSRVVGPCAMSITSAMAFGYDPKYCTAGCAETKTSPYFDSESARPWQDFGIRPSMMLGASTLAAAKTLIDRGVNADGSFPSGDGYLLRTQDVSRSVRYQEYMHLPALWSGNIELNYIDNSLGKRSDSISNKSNVLFYFTGLASVPNIASNTYLPGAIADSLTSFGGYLPTGNGQMPVTKWLEAGATASYGMVAEPCNFLQKFSYAPVLIDQYYRGATLIEAYWKSVLWPGQGLFVGEPLARPYRDRSAFFVKDGRYVITTRALRAKSRYALEYFSFISGSWHTLARFYVTRPQLQALYAPLPPVDATQIRWVGPCPVNVSQQCTLSNSY
jgi:uncharacterized protein (TIGR03790 family)